MLFCCNKYLSYFLQRSIFSIVLILAFVTAVPAQNNNNESSTDHFNLNPLLRSSFKPIKAHPLLPGYIKPTKHELMYWPNYPLTAAQIAERDKKYNRPIGQQIADEILVSTINSLIYGKKKPVAVRPKF